MSTSPKAVRFDEDALGGSWGQIPISLANQRIGLLAQASSPINNLLMTSPKELDNALTLSADRARRTAEAFGLKVPGNAPKPAKACGGSAALRRAQKA